VLLPIAHLVVIAIAWPAWLAIAPKIDTVQRWYYLARSIPLSAVVAGEVGIARIIDLGNVDSAIAIQTQDRVRRRGEGIELLGRAPGATPRGCSLAVEEFLRARST